MFRRLPASRQQQLRQLDDDFFALDAPQRDKLHVTLERYAVWLDRLSDANRKEILSAPAAEERLEAVRMIRKRLWRDRLPASVKERAASAADKDERDQIYADYRRQETERRNHWEAAKREWNNLDKTTKPFPFNDEKLARQVEEFVGTVLKPRLRGDELLRLEERKKETAQDRYGEWYFYGAHVMLLSEMHPSLPEPKNGKPITKIEDLPPDFLRRLRAAGPSSPNAKPPVKREFKDWQQYGKWPDFAEAVAKEAQDRGLVVPVSLGPCRPGEFKPEVEDALTALKPKLTAKEKSDLEALQGKWPQYPKLFVELARRHDLAVPGVTLPGSPALWNKIYKFPRRP
jgi:hypothetical protein